MKTECIFPPRVASIRPELSEVNFGSVFSELIQIRNTFIHVEVSDCVDQRNLHKNVRDVRQQVAPS